MPIVRLSDRGVIKVAGEDAEKLIGSLITNEIGLLRDSPAIYAGLLTPQGKLIADFFIVREGEGYLIDIALEKRAEVAAKLTIYRLRSKAVIEDAPELGVSAILGDGISVEGIVFTDPRLPEMGRRLIAAASTSEPHSAAAYHAHRIHLGVPEGGKDWDFGGAFPHEALLDQLHGVSFTKGCYVGQEIVARMEHRGTARSRVVKVLGGDALPDTRADILAGDVVIGKLGSVAGREGLALLRIDRAAEFIAKGQPITAGGVGLTLEVPTFARFAIAG